MVVCISLTAPIFPQSDYKRLFSSVVQATIVLGGMPLDFICLAMFSFSSCIPFSILSVGNNDILLFFFMLGYGKG